MLRAERIPIHSKFWLPTKEEIQKDIKPENVIENLKKQRWFQNEGHIYVIN